MKDIVLMGHIVGGFPTKETSLQAAQGIIEAGAKYLEVQFPFSDPSADGIVIEEACNIALKNGFKIQDGFDIIQELSQKAEILIMTYANIVFRYGVENFVKKAKESGAKGLIIPDLPIYQDEGLRKFAKKFHLYVVELIAPNTTQERIKILSQKSQGEFIYAVARAGITGSKTIISQDLFDYLDRIAKNCDKKIALGFGIQSYKQIQAIKDKIDIVVAGSYFVKQITKDSSKKSLFDHTLKLFNP
ncbi:tryptophan synthase subunit alpha [Helicobacter anatolicus]|uniref:tryptophan synthase subunit alpha n=1 Tax=Helicobacter anatolicus TaxID=2905874 RepID=UPI001E32FE02|nr:tryptophan synthase subunit alpha [Helicobacter anatolicus]MCE3039117.1 tryptophan synthase subunit alpha [Helicobacter anatolicus]